MRDSPTAALANGHSGSYSRPCPVPASNGHSGGPPNPAACLAALSALQVGPAGPGEGPWGRRLHGPLVRGLWEPRQAARH